MGNFCASMRLPVLGRCFKRSKGRLMATNEDIRILFDRYVRIENEMKLLREDKKILLAEFKEKVGAKAFQAALRAAKASAKLKPEERSEYDQVLNVVEKELCIDHID